MNNVGGYSLAHVGDRVREEGEHLVLLPVDTLAVGVDPPANKTNDYTDHTVLTSSTTHPPHLLHSIMAVS